MCRGRTGRWWTCRIDAADRFAVRRSSCLYSCPVCTRQINQPVKGAVRKRVKCASSQNDHRERPGHQVKTILLQILKLKSGTHHYFKTYKTGCVHYLARSRKSKLSKIYSVSICSDIQILLIIVSMQVFLNRGSDVVRPSMTPLHVDTANDSRNSNVVYSAFWSYLQNACPCEV